MSGDAQELAVSKPLIPEHHNGGRTLLPKEILLKCPQCRELLYRRDWERNLKVCQHCDYHFHLSAPERIALLLDSESFVETDTSMRSVDPLHFVSQSRGYATRLIEEQGRTGLNEAVVIGSGTIEGHGLALAIMDFHFMGGSMGSVVGEKVTRAIELAQEKGLPLLIVSASGGARMQEGILSLMQMAKTVVALARFREARLPFISLLTDPTMGGVAASFAMLGDVILAEPGARIGFAGPRVIEQFLHRKLPVDVDTAEFMLAHGMADVIVPRRQLRGTLVSLLRHYTRDLKRTSGGEASPVAGEREPAQEASPCSQGYERILTPKCEPQQYLQERQRPLSSWDQVQLARHRGRLHTTDYVRMLYKDFFELRGDRRYADDQAILGGLATFAGQTVMLIGHEKGRDLVQRQACNFGMPRPEGYRKAQRLMRQAEKFGFPVICLIDTPGAYPDPESEQRGQAQAIAESLEIMATLRVPIVAIVIGEGGSGGALALGLADRVFMLEHAIYTVAAPEAAASILWRDSTLAARAAEAMQITALALLELGVIDGIIREPMGEGHLDHYAIVQSIAERLHLALAELTLLPIADLLKQRSSKFRRIGHFSEVYADLPDK